MILKACLAFKPIIDHVVGDFFVDEREEAEEECKLRIKKDQSGLHNGQSLTDGAFVAATGNRCRQIQAQKHPHKIAQLRDTCLNFHLAMT